MPEGVAVRWVRTVLDGLKDFPDPELACLRAWETKARRADAESAGLAAEYAATLAEAEARFPGLEAPSEAELASRVRSRPGPRPPPASRSAWP